MGDEGGSPLTDYTALAVAIGGLTVRVDEGFKTVNENLKVVTDTAKDHALAIQRHEVTQQILDQRVAVLEKGVPKRTPWYQTAAIMLGIAAVLVSAWGNIAQYLASIPAH